MNYNHSSTYTYIFVSNVHIIRFVDFFKGMDDAENVPIHTTKKSINVFLTTEFSREIIETAVQFMNQIYTVLHLHMNRNGSFDQRDLHARTYEETFVYYTLNVKIERKS